MKQYVGISRDHSGSMFRFADAAMADYNLTIEELERASGVNNIDTVVSVVTHQGDVRTEVNNTEVSRLSRLRSYPTPGSSTPLFQSVDALINLLESKGASDSTYLVIAVTDGFENHSPQYEVDRIVRRIQTLQKTDHWTFVFRVPVGGNKQGLINYGIPAGNIQEWEQTERGFREATEQTRSAVTRYYGAVASGQKSTRVFFANADKLSVGQVASNMHDISGEVVLFPVKGKPVGDVLVKPFIEEKTGKPYRRGTAFYQLTKAKKATTSARVVQDYKTIIVRNQKTGEVFAGNAARDLLGLPHFGNIRLRPGQHGEWDIFVQSTSDNRILEPKTSVIYWENAR